MSNALVALTTQLAKRLDLGANGEELLSVLKATAFKGPATDAQMTALLVVSNQYGLNPWTKEIYAFPDQRNGIVPVIGVDGWSRIINENPQFDGMEFLQDDESCTCKMYRKDRGHAVAVTEYMAECKRDVGPWKSHPKRMLRHKAMIQCARLAFGLVGIYDEDEAERIIIEKDIIEERHRHSPVGAALEGVVITDEETQFLQGIAAELVNLVEERGMPNQAYDHLESQKLDNEEKLALWGILKPNSKTRAALKKEGLDRAMKMGAAI